MFPFDYDNLDGPLITTNDDWPVFDDVLVYAFSPSSSSSPSVESDPLPSTFPSAATLAAMPIPPSRSSPRNKNPDHIPRPRNAFMLFRSAFAAAQKISAKIEHDNRHITRIIAHCWNSLSEAEKQVWRDKAAAEKAQHAERYPNYRFSPIGRANRPVKRNVRRNGAQDVKRCEKLAELVMAGKLGQELETAVKAFDAERHTTEHVATSTSTDEHATRDPPTPDVPPFLSPLLPPATIASQTDPVPVPEPPACAAITNQVEPETSYGLANANDMNSLFGLGRQQSYSPGTPNGMSSPRSIPASDHYQSSWRFMQGSYTGLEQSVQDLSLFSWNQSDNFSYYN